MEKQFKWATRFPSAEMADSHFLTAIYVLAQQYDCTVSDVDMERRVLKIDGAKDKAEQLAIKIARALWQYLEE